MRSGKPATSETWVARNIFASYTVYQAISGNCYVILPESTHDLIKINGRRVHTGMDELMGKPKTPCASISAGKALVEENWRKKMASVLAD